MFFCATALILCKAAASDKAVWAVEPPAAARRSRTLLPLMATIQSVESQAIGPRLAAHQRSVVGPASRRSNALRYRVVNRRC